VFHSWAFVFKKNLNIHSCAVKHYSLLFFFREAGVNLGGPSFLTAKKEEESRMVEGPSFLTAKKELPKGIILIFSNP